MYKVSLAYIALTRNKNSPNHTNSMKFNGGKSVDHPIRTIDDGLLEVKRKQKKQQGRENA